LRTQVKDAELATACHSSHSFAPNFRNTTCHKKLLTQINN
jgi:hypothetical protein